MCQDLQPMRSDWPLIRFRASTPFRPWMIDCGLIEGKRIRYGCRTKAEAEEKAAELRAQRRREGELSLAPTRLDEDARKALAILAPHGATLEAAAKFYVANLEVVASQRSVAETIEELIKAKTQDGASVAYQKALHTRLRNSFAAHFGPQAIHEITTPELEDWLQARDDWSPVTRNNARRLINTLFSFACQRGYTLKNPATKVARAKEIAQKPGILSLEEARALLAASGDDMKPGLALLLFAGLRPEAELMRLDWSAIDLEDRSIDISSSKNSASHRFVKVSDNLAAFLEPRRRDSGAVSTRGSYFNEKMKNVRQRAVLSLRRAGVPCPSLEDWPIDCCRHTFASMHYAAFKHAHETAEQMGHTDLKMFFRHYRNRVKEAEAFEFWRLTPNRTALNSKVAAPEVENHS
jgi:integrase